MLLGERARLRESLVGIAREKTKRRASAYRHLSRATAWSYVYAMCVCVCVSEYGESETASRRSMLMRLSRPLVGEIKERCEIC